MFNFTKQHTYEELLVQKVMKEIKMLANTCPFRYLAVIDVIEHGETKKVYKYIFDNKKLYLDDEDRITGKEKDLNLKKYCFLFNGKPKNFTELEKYEALFDEIERFKALFVKELNLKKSVYRINDL